MLSTLPVLHAPVSLARARMGRASPAEFVLSLRGGDVDGALVGDLTISIVVLLAVALAARSGSALVAAICSTAPTGVPLSLWLLPRAATTKSGTLSVEGFLLACLKGVLALACFCLGALGVARTSTTEDPALSALLAAGFASWAAAWMLLQRVR